MGNNPSTPQPIGPGDHVLRLQIPPAVAEALLSEGMKIHLAVPTPTGLPFTPLADYRGPLADSIEPTPQMYNNEVRRSRGRSERLRTMQPRRLFNEETFDIPPYAREGPSIFETTPPAFMAYDDDSEDTEAENSNLMETSPPPFLNDTLNDTFEGPSTRYRTPSSRYPVSPSLTPRSAPRFGTPQRVQYARQAHSAGNPRTVSPHRRTLNHNEAVANEASRIARSMRPQQLNRRRTYTIHKGSPSIQLRGGQSGGQLQKKQQTKSKQYLPAMRQYMKKDN